MAKLQLSFACGLYDRMQPLYTGEVRPDGIDLNFIAIDQPRPIFDRMSGGQEFDVAEYSASEFTQRFTRNECPFVAIPVFPSIAFRMGFIAINKKSGIKTPKDLEGKRIGVPLYTMTAAIFINGILHHEFGVDLTKVHWVQSAMNEAGSHGHPTVLPLLKKMSIENNQSGKTLGRMLAAGEIDATLGTSLPEEIRTDREHRPAVSEFRRGRQGPVQAQGHLSDHAPGRHQEEHLRAISVRGDEPLRRVREIEEDRAAEAV